MAKEFARHEDRAAITLVPFPPLELVLFDVNHSKIFRKPLCASLRIEAFWHEALLLLIKLNCIDLDSLRSQLNYHGNLDTPSIHQ
jgi:hypothetical protein